MSVLDGTYSRITDAIISDAEALCQFTRMITSFHSHEIGESYSERMLEISSFVLISAITFHFGTKYESILVTPSSDPPGLSRRSIMSF